MLPRRNDMPPRTKNRDMGDYVAERKPFCNTNESCYAMWGPLASSELYGVFSYSTHHPLYAYDPEADMWFGNTTKVSATTARHASLAYPTGVSRDEMNWLDIDQMKDLIRAGSYAAYCGDRILTAHPDTQGQTSVA